MGKKKKVKNNGINLSLKEKEIISKVKKSANHDLKNNYIEEITDLMLETLIDNFNDLNNLINSFSYRLSIELKKIQELKEPMKNISILKELITGINSINALIEFINYSKNYEIQLVYELIDEDIKDIFTIDYSRVENQRIVPYLKEITFKSSKTFRKKILNNVIPFIDDIYNELTETANLIKVDLNMINELINNIPKSDTIEDVFLTYEPVKRDANFINNSIVQINYIYINIKTRFNVSSNKKIEVENSINSATKSIIQDLNHDYSIKLNDDNNFEFKLNVNEDNEIKITSKDNIVKNYSWKELNSLAAKKGYVMDRSNGDHGIWIKRDLNSSSKKIIIIPQGREIGTGLQRKILKDLGI